jgi:hypothetical protein
MNERGLATRKEMDDYILGQAGVCDTLLPRGLCVTM